MMIPQKWLRLQFNRQLRKGYVTNAEVDPPPTNGVLQCAEAGEVFVVRIVAKMHHRYWLTDRRMLLETEGGISTLFRYASVKQVHWMFRGWIERAVKSPEEEIIRTKRAHFDRLEVELSEGGVVLEGLDQAYGPIFDFLRLLTRAEKPVTTE